MRFRAMQSRRTEEIEKFLRTITEEIEKFPVVFIH
jgi:hypothetical protein